MTTSITSSYRLKEYKLSLSIKLLIFKISLLKLIQLRRLFTCDLKGKKNRDHRQEASDKLSREVVIIINKSLGEVIIFFLEIGGLTIDDCVVWPRMGLAKSFI